MKLNKTEFLEDLINENDYITITLKKEAYIYILELIIKDIEREKNNGI